MSFIDRTIAHHNRKGRDPNCALMVWLAAQASRLEGLTGEALDAEEDAIRAEMVQREDWMPVWSFEGILVSSAYDPARRSAVQAVYAQHIADNGETGLAQKLLALSGKALCAQSRAILQAMGQ